MKTILPPLIAALLDPARYPEPATHVELIETHASWLLLAGDWAYKIKKDITLPFLDYGTLDKRRTCCDEELRLNRRLAPGIYRDVVRIVGRPDDPHINGVGRTIEFAVRMRRFAEKNRLDHVCARGQLRPQQISELAADIAAFHEAAPVADPAKPFGQAEHVRQQALENLTELSGRILDCSLRASLARLATWTETESRRLEPLWSARRSKQRIRECHGDLHLSNLVLIDKRVTPFDCIEFSEDLRWIDVASEIAFTYVDLLHHRQPGLAAWLLSEWLEHSGDFEAIEVLRYYAVYRALVRAKVAAIRAAQGDGEPGQARSYLTLAENLIDPPQAQLVITHGVAGCGKSRAAKRLLLHDRSATTIRLRSDVERKRLHAMTPSVHSRSPTDGGIYSSEASELTYQRLQQLARRLLAARWSVIVDASFLERKRRDTFHQLASETASAFWIVAPVATLGRLRARVRGRLASGRDASEATIEVLERQLLRIEPLCADELAYAWRRIGVESLPTERR